MHKMIERGKTMLPVNLSSLRWNLQKKKNNINRRLRREKCWWDRSRVKKKEAASEARLGDVRLQINAQLLQRIIFKHVHCRCKAVRMKTPSASSRLSPIFILQTYEDYFFLRFFFYDNLGFTCKIFSYVSQDNKSNWSDDHPGRSFNYFSALNQFRCMRRVEAFPRSHRGTPRTGRRLG